METSIRIPKSCNRFIYSRQDIYHTLSEILNWIFCIIIILAIVI